MPTVSPVPRPRWWTAPGPALSDAGKDGELVLARVRLALLAALLFVPLSSLIRDPSASQNYTALTSVVTALVVGIIVWQAARHGDPPRGLGFFTAIADISLISATQAAYLMQGLPSAAVNNRTTFAFYLLAILATCLRWDARIVLVAGALAVVQYAGIVWWAAAWWGDMAGGGSDVYGAFVGGHQAGRVIILMAATGLAMAIVRQSAQLRHSSTHDALTGLANRGFFDERLAVEVDRAVRYGRPLAIAMLDLDRFKEVNDRYGHAVGDRVLQLAASALNAGLRTSDLLARYGGEEFVLAIPEADPEDVAAQLERLRQRLAATAIPVAADATVTVTCTVGVATLPADGLTAEALLRRADERLYDGKRAGRNRVVSSSSGVAARRPAGE